MNETVTQEFLVLFLNLVVGFGIGFLFDCYRVLRSLLRPGWFFTQLTDFLFWILCAALAFGVLFLVTGGEVRFYTLLIIPAGLGIYLKFTSSRLQGPLFNLFVQLSRLFRFCLRTLVFGLQLLFLPVRFAWHLIRIFFQVAAGLFKLFWLLVRFFLRWTRRKTKEAVRALKLRRPPSPPPNAPP
ncbi:MAG: spore cortex biosynthesis protein YabQ [Bacillota bacterium]|nr:spore cortex biosynthesis protein YabQ [Bacillota bacterium]